MIRIIDWFYIKCDIVRNISFNCKAETLSMSITINKKKTSCANDTEILNFHERGIPLINRHAYNAQLLLINYDIFSPVDQCPRSICIGFHRLFCVQGKFVQLVIN